MAMYCALCGSNLALVGRAHRCIPRADAMANIVVLPNELVRPRLAD